MSFSLTVKREISGNMRRRYAGAYGFFLFLKGMDAGKVSFKTECPHTSAMFEVFARQLLGAGTVIEESESTGAGNPVYASRLSDPGDRDRLLYIIGDGIDRCRLVKQEETGAFLAGAFLAGGNITDPEKSCHLEFTTWRENLAHDLRDLVDRVIPGAKLANRRGVTVLYYKDRGQIGDLLTLMGASKASLTLIDVEMIKEVRNRANRVTNCETANIDKTVSAAAGQVAAITLILNKTGLDSLSLELRETAILRLENPDLSLRELAQLHDRPPSRSVLHRRFEKLGKTASKLSLDSPRSNFI